MGNPLHVAAAVDAVLGVATAIWVWLIVAAIVVGFVWVAWATK